MVRLFCLFIFLLAVPAAAQVPPHAPGTVCITAKFWCWAQPPGVRGTRCFCPTPSGPVEGVLS